MDDDVNTYEYFNNPVEQGRLQQPYKRGAQKFTESFVASSNMSGLQVQETTANLNNLTQLHSRSHMNRASISIG